MGYPHMPSVDPHGPSLGVWGSPYSPSREDWNVYPGPSGTVGTVPMNDMISNPSAFGCQEYSNLGPVGGGSTSGSLPAPASRLLFPIDAEAADASSPNRSRHSPMTKEKYRVVYTDDQRLELEKEFHCNRYIIIRRKSELANCRAKEKKMIRKKISQFENSGSSVQSNSGSISPGELPPTNLFFTTSSAVHRFQPIEIQRKAKRNGKPPIP
ncbi:unnamed protein product [Nyctereutes procyonoides]|uniref:(raccoon dog) hypothetical protein n=1 Tax=Nyctereutes procyonoides TaxID=34880 RepID=A0A811YCS5_NYCPR|nr:unnamed protein product [Nyctereutes procyonoides]